jgi:hypothetical protein
VIGAVAGCGGNAGDRPARPALDAAGQALRVDVAVGKALRALQRRRTFHIRGRTIRMVSRLTPRRLSIRMNGRMLGLAAQRQAQSRSQVPA